MRKSAGILLFRKKQKKLEVFLVHPGGPFWKGKEAGAWSIPKGEFLDDEQALLAARREFEEETGQKINGEFIELISLNEKTSKQHFVQSGNIDP